ncbi:MAG TPA: 2-oxo-4-hydroxy-4-carboxy-5-ureidoimidazoline decarboxylase [Candidatus Obscuribacterales bacterium]
MQSGRANKIEEFNALSEEMARVELLRCCGSQRWVEQMTQKRPFASCEQIFTAAGDIWYKLSSEDWLEAFSHHPKIGDLDSLKAKFGNTRAWAAAEQKGVSGASEEVLEDLARANEEYESKFGYIFIVCATGKSAGEMLSILKSRLANDPATELAVAAQEQAKITKIRLEKLFT